MLRTLQIAAAGIAIVCGLLGLALAPSPMVAILSGLVAALSTLVLLLTLLRKPA